MSVKPEEPQYVVDLRMGSLQATLVAHPKRGHALSFRPVVAAYVGRAVVEGLRSVEYAPTVPAEFPEPSMRRTQQLGNLIGKSGGPKAMRATLTSDSLQASSARVTAKIASNAKEALTPRQQTRGSLIGTLEVISVHQGQVVTLYDEINRRATRGTFDRSTQFDLVKSALGKRVVVDGVLSRNSLGEIVSIDMTKIELLPDESDLPSVRDLIGSEPELTGGLTAVEYQRVRREA